VARAATPVSLLHVGELGIEQDVDEIWSAVLSAIAQLGSAAELSSVRAVGVSSQGGALQMLDGNGRPRGRVISWMDGRARSHNKEITRRLGSDWFSEHTGHGCSGVAVGQLLCMRNERPETVSPPNRVGFVGDVIVSRLCGRAAHDATSLSLTLLFNPSLRKADPALLRELGIDEGQLPELLSPRTAAGALLAEAARRTSLPAGIPVSAAVHDQYAAALGCGAVRAGDVMFGAGTAWVLLAVSDRLAPPVIPQAFVCTHVVEGLYGQILSLVNGGSSFSWAAGLLGLRGKAPVVLDQMLERVPAGSDGVRFWPLLAPGGGVGLEAGAAGRLTGLRLSHTAGDIMRAVVEGLAFELARYLGFLTDGGVPVGRLVMCGGAAESRVTPQIVADVMGLPITCCGERDTSALGAAIIARGLVERETGLAALSDAMVSAGRTLEPGPASGLYRELLAEYVGSLPTAQKAASR
jgi:xylulokinase